MGCSSSQQRDSAIVLPTQGELPPPRAPTPPPKIKATIVFVCGPPSVGKGTQCARIRDQFDYSHLSTGDLLREEAARGTARGQRIAEVMAAGDLVAGDVVLELLRDAIDSTSGPHRHFLIDGFPSTESQAAAFERVIGEPAFVLALEAPDDALRNRYTPPGSAAEVESAFTARLATFREQTQPVLDRYGQLGVLRSVDADRPADEVFADVSLLFEAQRAHERERAGSRSSSHLRRPPSSATVAVDAVGADAPPSAATVVFVVGPPAVGKGTQCGHLRRGGFGFTHLSTGYLLRMEVAKGSELGTRVAAVMAAGGVVDDRDVLHLLRRAVDGAPGPHRRVLIDGFPISVAQAAAFEAALCAPVCVLALEAPEATLEERALERARTSGRDDDNVDAFHRRLAAYREQMQPVLDLYTQRGALHRVDAARSAEDVFADVARVFDELGLRAPPAGAAPLLHLHVGSNSHAHPVGGAAADDASSEHTAASSRVRFKDARE